MGPSCLRIILQFMGREALRSYFRDLFARLRYRFALTSTVIELAGDMALEHVTYTATSTRSNRRWLDNQ